MTNYWMTAAAVLLTAGTLRAAGLDGTRWNVTLRPDQPTLAAGEKGMDDTLEFKNGKMTSSYCKPYGFGASEYKFSQASGVTAFMTVQTSEKAGSNRWDGVTDGPAGAQELKGTMVATPKDGKTKTYLFQGKKAPAKTSPPKKAM